MNKYVKILFFGFFIFVGCEDEQEPVANDKQITFTKDFDITNFDTGVLVTETFDRGFLVLTASDTTEYGVHYNLGLIKTDSIGTQEWVKENIMDSVYLSHTSLRQTIDGGYVVFGDPTIKFDSSGVYEWTADLRYEGITNEGGFFGINYSFNFETFTFDLNLTKATDAGVMYWEKDLKSELMQLDSNFYFVSTTSIIETNEGGFFIIGYLNPSFPAIIKTDSEGNVEWANILYDIDEYFGLTEQTNDGGYILFGSTTLKLSAQGQIEWENNNLAGRGQHTDDGGYIHISQNNSSIDIKKSNSLGSNIWENSFPHENNSRYNYFDINQTTDGGYIITGGTQVSGWDRDIVLIKTDSEGNLAE